MNSLLLLPLSYCNLLPVAAIEEFQLCPAHCDVLLFFFLAFYLARKNRLMLSLLAFVFHSYCYISIAGIFFEIEPLIWRPALLPWPPHYTPQLLIREVGAFIFYSLFQRHRRPWND